MERIDRYFSGQGKVYFAERNADGAPKGFKFLGNCSELNLSVDTENAEHNESYTGQGVEDRYIETGQSAMLNITLDNFIRQNLALAMFGEPKNVEATEKTESHNAQFTASISLVFNDIDPSLPPTVRYQLSSNPSLIAEEGTDYTVNYSAGEIDILSGGNIADGEAIEITYNYRQSENHKAYRGSSIFLNRVSLNRDMAVEVKYDLSGSVLTATEGTDYEVNHFSGRLDIPEGSAIADGETVSIHFSWRGQELVGAFTRKNEEKYFIFEGLNRAEDFSPVIIHCFKTRLQPLDEWALISDDFADLSIEGSILWDTTRPEDATGGRFFKVVQPQREYSEQ